MANTHERGGHRVVAAAMSTAGMTAIVKLVTVGRDLVIAWQFGTADAIDAFLIAFLLPAAIINIVVGSFASAIIPGFVRLRDSRGPAAANRFAENALAASLALLLVLAGALALSAPMLLSALAAGFAPEKLALAQSLLFVLLPAILFQSFAMVWGALLNACGRFAVVALVPLATPVIMVALLLAVGGRIGAHALALGVTIGSAAEAGLLGMLANRHRLPLRPRWHGLDSETTKMMRQYGPLVAGAALMSGTLLVDQAMAAMLEPGSVAALNYGNKLVSLILSVAALSLGTAALPYFSERAAADDMQAVRRSLASLLPLIAVLSVPAVLALVLLSTPLITIIFERGAFTAADTAAVARIQAMYLLQVPFYLAGILGVRVLSALSLNHIILVIATINFALNVVLNLVLMHFIGLPGIALATSLVYASSAAMIYLALWPRLVGRTRLRSSESA